MSWLDKQQWFKSIKRIKVFFLQEQWKESLIFLFFLLLSLGFWFLLQLQQEYEVEISVPVKYRNIPSEMDMTEEFPQEIIAKLRDKGIIILNYSWLHSFSPFEVNLNDIRKDGNYQVTKRAIEAGISKHLIATTSLLEFEPETFTIEYKTIQFKEVAVEADFTVSLEPGFQISDPITVVPEKVRIYADNNILDLVSNVKTVHTELKKTNETKNIKVKLQKIPNVRIDPDEVTVTVPVEEFTERRMMLAVGCSDLPENYIVRIFPSIVEVICNVPLSRFRGLEDTDFEISIPFEEFETHKSSGKLPVYLTKKPSWIAHTAIVPSSIEFIIEQLGQ
jgi:hypothetical protein